MTITKNERDAEKLAPGTEVSDTLDRHQNRDNLKVEQPKITLQQCQKKKLKLFKRITKLFIHPFYNVLNKPSGKKLTSGINSWRKWLT